MTDDGHGADVPDPSAAPDVGAYCRAIESYLCIRNGGHRIRLVGPAFDVARAWHGLGIPLKVVEQGIDRRLERAELRGVRQPMRLEYCEADVVQAFAGWRRAVGPLVAQATDDPPAAGPVADATRGPSLPRHLDRVATRLSSAIVQLPGGPLRDLGGTTSAQVDAMRATAARARGEVREALLARLATLDGVWDEAVLECADPALVARGRAEADRDLASYRGRMPPDEYRRAADRLAAKVVREALGVPRFAP